MHALYADLRASEERVEGASGVREAVTDLRRDASREARRLRDGGDAAVMRVMHVDPTDRPVPPLELAWSAARDPENT